MLITKLDSKKSSVVVKYYGRGNWDSDVHFLPSLDPQRLRCQSTQGNRTHRGISGIDEGWSNGGWGVHAIVDSLMEEEDEEDDLPVFGDNVAEMINANSQYPLAVEELSDE